MFQTINKSWFYPAWLCLGFILGSSVASIAQADIRLPGIISDHMVIQQGQPVQIWGQADPGEKVTGRLADYEGQTVATDAGIWQLFLKPPSDEGSYELILQGKNRIVLRDVVVGEVWLASGQSNMGWPVRLSMDGDKHMADARNPSLRLFKVPERSSSHPTSMLDGYWEVVSPNSVKDFSAVAYFFGQRLQQEIDKPVGIISATVGGTRVESWIPPSLLQEDWSKPPIRPGRNNPLARDVPGALYNGMIHPLRRYRLRGALWYQGESNVADGNKYLQKFSVMAEGWRSNWQPGPLPFYFMQLAPYNYGKNPYVLPAFRDAQSEILKQVAHTGMVVTTDLGDLTNVHPKRKAEVGERLAKLVLSDTYERNIAGSASPMLHKLERVDDRVRVVFDNVGSGLATNNNETPDWFEIAGSDGIFRPASAMIISKDSVMVWHQDIHHPADIRFGWHQEAVPNLISREGLPACPFRSHTP